MKSVTSENLCEPSLILAQFIEIFCEPRRLWRHGSRAPAPIAKKSTGNQRKEHNVEKYIQWATTLSPTIRVYLHSFSSCCLQNLRKPAKFSANANVYHSRSSISVLVKYATFCFLSSIVTLDTSSNRRVLFGVDQ